MSRPKVTFVCTCNHPHTFHDPTCRCCTATFGAAQVDASEAVRVLRELVGLYWNQPIPSGCDEAMQRDLAKTSAWVRARAVIGEVDA